MTFELTMLLAVMVLAATLWVPYVIGFNLHPPPEGDPFRRPPDVSHQPDWVRRADRAHLNLLEQAMPFAVLVLMAHLVAVTSAVTVWACGLFVALRIAHAAGMISGLIGFPVRPIIFTTGWACTIAIAVEILRLT